MTATSAERAHPEGSSALSPSTSRIGVVGLGNIGEPMARALLRAGWALTVLDRHPDRAGALAQAGARVADGPGGLAGCDVLVLVVPDDAAVCSLLEGEGGWLAADGPSGRSVVIHSTVLPETAARLAQVAAGHGVGLLDAPVSGGAARALDGDLTVMAGGDAEVLEHLRPLLEAEASQVVHVGAAGAGAAAKLANQLMMLSALAGAHEALDLAAAHGVRAEALFGVVASSTGDSWVARNWSFFDETSAAYERSGTPLRERPWSKDLFEVVEAARAADLRVPVAALLSQVLADRVEDHARRTARAAAPQTVPEEETP